jgi:tetratricopeptide (TPR) repeat protein
MRRPGVLVRITKLFGVTLVTSVFCVSAWGQTPAPAQSQSSAPATQAQPAGTPEKKVKDRGEYDLFDTVTKEQNPQKRLEALNTWAQKYPETDYKKERLLFYLTTYQQLNKPKDMMDTTQQILALDPKDFTALMWTVLLTLPPTGTDASAGAQDRVEKAAQGMLANLDATFAKDKKPAGMDDAAWAKQRTSMEALAHKALGWVAMVRKNNDQAEQEIAKSLAIDPGQSDIVWWVGQMNYGTKDPAKIPAALYEYARAATYDGPGALEAGGRKQIDDFLTKAYKGYHGDTNGLAELKAQAKVGPPLAPAGFTIKSVTDISKEQMAKEQEELTKDPARALWKNLKGELTGANGPQYFESSMKGAGLPELKGKVVSSTSKEVVLAMSDDATPEATLKLTEGAVGKVEPGTVLTFAGAQPTSYTASPFMVTMEIERKQIKGLSAAAAPARKPVHRAPVRKKAA